MRLVATAMVVSLVLACGPSEETAHTPDQSSEPAAPDVRGEVVEYEVDGVPMTGYLAFDAGSEAPRPGVLVVHEWWGANDYVRKRADMLAKMGYTAFALDMYGSGKLAEHPDDAQKFMMEIVGNMQVGVDRFNAAREILEGHASTDAAKTAAIGYCFGGGVVLHMARIGSDLDAVASFHGGLATESPAAPGVVVARVLVANGADDPLVPPEQVEAFRQEMAAAGVDLELVDYPGVQHSFTNPGSTEVGQEFGMPLVYDEAADLDSWKRLEAFLAETFGAD